MKNKHSNITQRNINDQIEQILIAHHEDSIHFRTINGTVRIPNNTSSSTKKDISKLVGVERIKPETGE